MDDGNVALPDWFGPLCDLIAHELDLLSQARHDRGPALVQEAAQLRVTLHGWSLSLAKPDLNASLREDLEAQYGQAKARLRDLEADLAAVESQQAQHLRLVDPQQGLERLARLHEVLASGNVPRGHLELCRHIDRIDVHADGHVVMRTSKLGIFDGAAALLARPSESATPAYSDVPTKRVQPRRRGRLRIDEPLTGKAEALSDIPMSTDPGRFADLEPRWFWVDTFEIPGPACWAAENAAPVAGLRKQGWTMARLSTHFGRTLPTIRHALRIAAQRGLMVHGFERPAPSCWAAENAAPVARLRKKGWTLARLAAHFGRTTTTIHHALRIAAERGLITTPPANGPTQPGEEPDA